MDPQSVNENYEPLIPISPAAETAIRGPRTKAPLIWRQGKTLILRKGAELPARCVKCNGEPAGPPLLRTLSWHESWVYIFVCIALLLYVVIALVTRKQAKVHVHLCQQHRARRRNHMLVGGLITLAGFGLIVPAVIFDAPALIPVIILMIIGGLIYLLLAQQTVRAVRIDDQFVHLRGVCPEFLEGLPPFKS